MALSGETQHMPEKSQLIHCMLKTELSKLACYADAQQNLRGLNYRHHKERGLRGKLLLSCQYTKTTNMAENLYSCPAV